MKINFFVMKKICLAIILFSISTGFDGFSQSRKLLNIPRKYLNNPDGSILSNSTLDADEKNAWIVCSDRSNNKTYEKPGGGSEMKTMNFMEKFYVTGEEGDYLQLWKWDENAREGGRSQSLKKTATYYGWAPKSKLLLWLRCLENEKRLGQKALPILKQTNYKTSDNFVRKEGTLRLFNDPGLTKESNNAIKMFQFLYIYKREGNSYLLAKGYESNFFRIDMDVLGWVDKEIVQVWNDRVCLEPNWDDDAVSERKAAGIKSSLFVEKQNAISWQNGTTKLEPVWDDDPYETRKEANWKRFPILEWDKESDIVKTGYVTNVVNEKNETVATTDQHANDEKKANERIADIRKINVVFVVDAGAEMKEYLGSVQYVMEKMRDRQINVNSENKVRFGAVVYRDEQDGNCPEGKLDILKTAGLSPNSGEVLELISKQSSISGCKKTSKALGGAMKQALRMIATNSNKDQTNIIVVIGGAGGSRTPKIEEELSSLIAASKVNLLSFQVIQGVGPAFEQFIPFFVNIQKSSSKKSVQLNKTGLKGKTLAEPKYLTVGENTYMMDYPTTSDIMGILSFANRGQSLPTEEVNKSVDSLMSFVDFDIERKIDGLNANISGIGTRDVKLDASLLRYFASIGEDAKGGQDLVKKYTGKSFQFFIPGYTSVKVNKLERPVYKKVIFTSNEELQDLSKTFRELQYDGTANDIRNKIVDAYIAILASYIGDKKVKEVVNTITPAKIWEEYITGLPVSNDKLLNQYSIADYKNPKKVSDDEIRRMQAYLQSKYNGLQNIDPRYILKLDWGTYYWIPEDYLP